MQSNSELRDLCGKSVRPHNSRNIMRLKVISL